MTESINTLDKATLGKFTQGNFMHGHMVNLNKKYYLGLKVYSKFPDWVDFLLVELHWEGSAINRATLFS